MLNKIKRWFSNEPEGFKWTRWVKPVNQSKGTEMKTIVSGNFIPNSSEEDSAFFGQGSLEEYEDFKKEEDGTAPWYKRLKNL